MKLNKILLLLLLFTTSPIFADYAVIFMYHRFGEPKYPSTNITLEQFQFQIDYLQKNKYNVWHLSKILRHIINKEKIPPKTVAITIDDAYLSTYKNAYPMLKKKNFPFTVTINTKQIDLKSKNYMSWEQMREMKANGVEFTNHTVNHPYLIAKKNEKDASWEKRIIKEIEEAQSKIQDELGVDTNENPRIFTYPFGEYDTKTAQLVKELGYIGISQTSGTVEHNSDLRAIKRFPMSESFASEDGFITKLNTLPMPIESTSSFEPLVRNNNPPKLRIKLKMPLENIRCYISNGDAINFDFISQTEIEVYANEPIQVGREKYTCTAPAENGKWYWYSHLWILKK
ncbi:MAG: biofilm PGA synthesis lipoprotein PgaB [Sulfurimonas sp.]|jgi:biofilm PGA synthesis lipoprotein PgaB